MFRRNTQPTFRAYLANRTEITMQQLTKYIFMPSDIYSRIHKDKYGRLVINGNWWEHICIQYQRGEFCDYLTKLFHSKFNADTIYVQRDKELCAIYDWDEDLQTFTHSLNR